MHYTYTIKTFVNRKSLSKAQLLGAPEHHRKDNEENCSSFWSIWSLVYVLRIITGSIFSTIHNIAYVLYRNDMVYGVISDSAPA